MPTPFPAPGVATNGRPAPAPTTQRPLSRPQTVAAKATAAEVPHIDFDEGGDRVVASITLGGELFDIPPMPATTMAWFVEIQGMPLDDPGAFDAVKQFVIRCLHPADRERGAAALDRSPVTMVGLMEKGSLLMQVATGVPPQAPSAASPEPLSTPGASSTDHDFVTGVPGFTRSQPGN